MEPGVSLYLRPAASTSQPWIYLGTTGKALHEAGLPVWRGLKPGKYKLRATYPGVEARIRNIELQGDQRTIVPVANMAKGNKDFKSYLRRLVPGVWQGFDQHEYVKGSLLFLTEATLAVLALNANYQYLRTADDYAQSHDRMEIARLNGRLSSLQIQRLTFGSLAAAVYVYNFWDVLMKRERKAEVSD
jgi:hypothetical protein